MKKEVTMIEFLDWVYNKQKAEMAISSGVGLFDIEAKAAGFNVFSGSGDGVNVVESNGRLGTSIDSSRKFGCVDLHYDAEVAYDYIMGLERHKRMLVADYAKTCSVPDWSCNAQAKMVAVVDDDGNPIIDYDEMASKILKRRVAPRCRVTIINPEPLIMAKRDIYNMWYNVLKSLLSPLNQRICKHYIYDVGVVSEPWVKAS